MRCSKVKELYFGNYDGLLNEAEKMKLLEHLDGCPACACFVEEMDRCLGMLKELPDLSPSENFEWNLKRRLLMERSKVIMRRGGDYFGERQWGLKFLASAAAVLAVVLLGAWFMDGRSDGPILTLNDIADNSPTARFERNIQPPGYGVRDITSSSQPAELKMVSDDILSSDRSQESTRAVPFQFASESREDSLYKETEALKRRIEELERANRYYRNILTRLRYRR